MNNESKKADNRSAELLAAKKDVDSLIEKLQLFSNYLHNSHLSQEDKTDFSNKLLDMLSDDKHQALRTLAQRESMVDSIGRALVAAETNDKENWYRYELRVVRGVLGKLNRQKPAGPDERERLSFDTIPSDDEEESSEHTASPSEQKNNQIEAMVKNSIFANQAETSEAEQTTSNKQTMAQKTSDPSFKPALRH